MNQLIEWVMKLSLKQNPEDSVKLGVQRVAVLSVVIYLSLVVVSTIVTVLLDLVFFLIFIIIFGIPFAISLSVLYNAIVLVLNYNAYPKAGKFSLILALVALLIGLSYGLPELFN